MREISREVDASGVANIITIRSAYCSTAVILVALSIRVADSVVVVVVVIVNWLRSTYPVSVIIYIIIIIVIIMIRHRHCVNNGRL